MDTAKRRNELHVQQINEAVDQQLDAELRSLDTTIKNLRAIFVHNHKDFDQSARDILSTYPKGMIQFVNVLDANGHQVYSSENKPGATPQPISFADQEYFQVHINSTIDQLFISNPRLGRLSGVPIIEFSRPIWNGKHFAGVIGIPLRPDYLSNNLWSLHINPNDMISIVREDGRILVCSRKMEDGFKLTSPSDRPFMRSHSGDHGIFRETTITDKVPLLFSWRHLVNYPIIAVAAMDEVTELRNITDQQSTSRIRAQFSIALVMGFSLWISALLLRDDRKNHALGLTGV